MVKKGGKVMSRVTSLPRNQEYLFTSSFNIGTFQYDKCRIFQLCKVPETYSEPCQTSKMGRYAKIFNGS